jgi:enoyl-CoA hydratase
MSLVEISDPVPGVRQLTLARPDRLNAMTAELVEELHVALEAIAVDRTVRVVVLSGAGRAFCAGLDLNGYGSPPRASGTSRVHRGLDDQRHIASLVPRLRHLPQPVIAAVNGAATGGGLALVLASDVRIAAEEARFGASFIRVGFSACDIGTSWMLPRLVGAGRAHELMLTGRLFDAAEARDIGLVLEVVPGADLLSAAYRKAEQIMENSPIAVELTKQGMWVALETPGQEASIEFENRQQILTLLTEDHLEAKAAFLEKRPPAYRDA